MTKRNVVSFFSLIICLVLLFMIGQNLSYASDNIKTIWLDSDKNILKEAEGTHKAGEIKGYEFVETKKDELGNITHYFKKNAINKEYITHFVDEATGNKILPDYISNEGFHEGYGELEKFYNTGRSEVDGNEQTQYYVAAQYYYFFLNESGDKSIREPLRHLEKELDSYPEIENYTFIGEENAADKNGGSRYVHFLYYKRNPISIKTIWLDSDKNILKEAEGTHKAGEIKGYEFVETKKDELGNITHYFKKNAINKEYITHFVDEATGNKILPDYISNEGFHEGYGELEKFYNTGRSEVDGNEQTQYYVAAQYYYFFLNESGDKSIREPLRHLEKELDSYPEIENYTFIGEENAADKNGGSRYVHFLYYKKTEESININDESEAIDELGVGNQSVNSDKTSNVLPKTGSSNDYFSFYIGLIIIFYGSFSIFKKNYEN